MKRLLLALVFILTVTACGPRLGQEVVQVERLVTATPVPATATASPTATAAATATAVSTATPSPVEEVTEAAPTAVVERPFITDTSPATNLHTRRPDIRLTFSQAMDQASVAAALTIQPAIPYQLTWESERVLLIQPTELLAPAYSYSVHLSSAATNSAGVYLVGGQTYTFRTPRVVARYDLPTAADPLAAVEVHFNYVMDTVGVAAQFKLEPAAPGTITWNDEGTVLTFTPTEPLRRETEYRVSFAGRVAEANGDLLSSIVSQPFITSSWVTAVSPDGYSVSPSEPIRINFFQPVNKTTAAAAFSLSPATPGTISWEENTMVFTPINGRFPDFAYYRFDLNNTATDLQGQPLFSQPQAWYFQTSHYADVADFGSGYDVQIVAANGRRAVHYRGYNQGQKTVTFNLYQLTPEQFISQYATGDLDTSRLPLARTWQEQTSPEGDEYLDPQELIIPSDVAPAPYILTLSSDFVNDSLFILLTNHTLVAKQTPGQLVAWATDFANQPAAGLRVELYDTDGRFLTSQTSDNSGLATLTPSGHLSSSYLIARDGSDITLTGFEWGWRRTGYSSQQSAAAIHISTDRPIYRPGHTVYYKAIVRQIDDVTASPVVEGTAVTASIRDARGNTVQTFNLTANDYGTVNGQFQLSEGAMLGSYRVVISYDGVTREQEFKVEDYRKPDHAVTVTTDATAYLTGSPISVTVDSQYFLGEPVANADVVVTLYYSWGYYDEFDEGSVVRGKTDGNGRFTTTFSSIHTRDDGSYIVEAVIDDGSHQGVAAQAPVQVYELAESISLERGRYLKTPQQPFNVTITVSDIFGQPVANRQVDVQLRRYRYDEGSTNGVVDSFVGTTDGNGRFTATLTAAEAGYYRLTASSTDQRGNHIERESWLLAYHRTYWSSWFGRSEGLTLYTSEESYHFADTAQLFVESNISGPALLTIERNDVLDQRVIELTAPLTTIDIPLNQAYTPNVYATIQVWKPLSNTLHADMSYSIPDAELLVSSIKLNVPAIHKKLTITITPDKAEYAPGETATITLRTTNFVGDPVSAEVALAVVDEAIFSLSPDLTRQMYDTFYFERGNQVVTYDSMRPTRGLWIPGGMGGGGGGGGGGGLEIGRPRTNFQDTAAWYPVLRTDANGEVTVSFTLPDDLTSWRLTARAVTADTQIGETSFNIITKKEIVVSPILPRILTAGDSFILSTIIHNYSSQPRTLSVQLAADSDSFTLTGEAVQSITIAPDGQQIVGWPVAVPEAGTVELTISANDGQGGDALRLPLTVQPLAIPDMTTQVGQFTGEFNTTVTLPANALPMGTITVDLSRSIAGSLLDGAEYLTGYPYGCVEQTMSRALPNAVVGRALFQLGIGDPARFAELEPMIQASIQRLYGFQHSDGGWGWWYSDPTHDYQTAWVVFGLAVTADAGYEIDPAVIARGATWLNDHLAVMDSRTRAFALYSMALAGQGNSEETLALAEELDSLDTFSRAALALALWEVGETAVARQTVDYLLETVTVTGSYAYWTGDSDDGYYHQKTMASDVRNTALALSAISQIRPGQALEGSIVRWLMAQRRSEGWGTTNETAFTLLALTDHLLAQPDVAADTEYTVWLNGEVVETGVLGRGRPSPHLVIPAAAAQTGENELRI
ncbi:MAG: Ig-like domain-containing protein, partial [Ardenticatenaceae bacterium]|nr:Ig-like domain-containing protein [Ardenticatenaceae bacterium]